MKTVVEELLDKLKEASAVDDKAYRHIENMRGIWLEKEKQQIINAVQWKGKSNMGKVYFDSLFNRKKKEADNWCDQREAMFNAHKRSENEG